MPLGEALEMANAKGLDLVEVAPKVNPPVVKILSYDKFRYHLEKTLRQQKKKQKKVEVKGIRISVRIGIHDLEFKARQAEKFMKEGNKVKVEMFLRGRERANLEFAFGVLKKFLASVIFPYTIEQQPKKLGSLITAIIAPKT